MCMHGNLSQPSKIIKPFYEKLTYEIIPNQADCRIFMEQTVYPADADMRRFAYSALPRTAVSRTAFAAW